MLWSIEVGLWSCFFVEWEFGKVCGFKGEIKVQGFMVSMDGWDKLV